MILKQKYSVFPMMVLSGGSGTVTITMGEVKNAVKKGSLIHTITVKNKDICVGELTTFRQQ